MYRSNVTYPQLREYLDHLVRSCLLERVKDTKTYITTPMGAHFVETFDKMKMLAESKSNQYDIPLVALPPKSTEGPYGHLKHNVDRLRTSTFISLIFTQVFFALDQMGNIMA